MIEKMMEYCVNEEDIETLKEIYDRNFIQNQYGQFKLVEKHKYMIVQRIWSSMKLSLEIK